MIEQATEVMPPSAPALLSGIVDDAQRLLRQEVQLAKQEFKQEWQKTKSAAVSFLAGTAALVLAMIFLLFMVVYLLAYYTPIPIWGCYGIVGGVLAVIALTLLMLGKKEAGQIQLLPPQTVATLKENAQWIQNRI
jgi:cobalamin biosynthesis protein CobD/CbiB